MSRPERTLQPGRSALDTFGFELRRWRKRGGLTQDRLGKYVHVSGDLIQKVELGERRPSHQLAADCDAALQANGALIQAWREVDAERRPPLAETDKTGVVTDNIVDRGSAPLAAGTMIGTMGGATEHHSTAMGVQWTPTDRQHSTDKLIVPCWTEDGRLILVSVSRRSFLLGGVGATASAIVGAQLPANPPAAKLIANHSSSNASHIERFESMRVLLRDCDNAFGPQRVIQLASEQIRLMQHLRNNARGSDSEKLLRIHIEFADLLAWLHQDSGNYHDAQYWLGRALDWSHMLGDSGTIAFILARKSQLAGQALERTEALQVAEAAIAQAKPRSRSAVIAATYAAHGHALRVDKTACMHGYDLARQLLDKMDDEPEIWYGQFLDAAYIDVSCAQSLSVLGEYKPALETFAAAINTLPSGYYRDRGVYLARKAFAHAGAANSNENDADQHANQAANAGLEALTIGSMTGSARIISELADLNGKLSRWRKLPSVIEFQDSMRELCTPLVKSSVNQRVE